jgi:hypothetical protein
VAIFSAALAPGAHNELAAVEQAAGGTIEEIHERANGPTIKSRRERARGAPAAPLRGYEAKQSHRDNPLPSERPANA